jgi:hypothetical protein
MGSDTVGCGIGEEDVRMGGAVVCEGIAERQLDEG